MYSLRLAVNKLSAGYVDDEWMAEVARPVMRSLKASSPWPSDLVTFDVNAMLIRETTHFNSPVIFDRNMLGQHIPILLTSAGRAFLFSCTEEKRQQIVDVLAKKTDEESFLARNAKKLRELQADFDEMGCAFMAWRRHSNRAAIAVPILKDGLVLGSINMIYHLEALPTVRAINKHLPMLKGAAQKIGSGMSQNAVQV